MIDYLPYVGITGFTDIDEVKRAIDQLPADMCDRQLMVGVLASYESIRGLAMKPIWQGQFPDPRSIGEIFYGSNHCSNLVHLSTSEESPESLLDDMLDLHQIVGDVMDGFQLNVAWPDVRLLDVYRRRYEDSRIVLQIGKKALEQVGNAPTGLVRKLKEYATAEYITDILLDPSGGLGKEFETQRASDFLRALIDADFGFGLGVAGGLSAQTLHLVEPLLLEFERLSFDAQGKLRRVTEQDPSGVLDDTAVSQYLDKAFALCSVIRY